MHTQSASTQRMTDEDTESVTLWRILQWALEAAGAGPNIEIEATEQLTANARPSVTTGERAFEQEKNNEPGTDQYYVTTYP